MFGKPYSDGSFASAKKGGCKVGKTKRGKRDKDHGSGRPIRSPCRRVHRKRDASRSEACRVLAGADGGSRGPQNLIGDNAYDSDKLDAELKPYGIEVIAPHRRNRKNKTQDGRRLRRYRRRWKIETLFAWLQNFRRLVVRYERHAENFLGMLHLGCCVILLRYLRERHL